MNVRHHKAPLPVRDLGPDYGDVVVALPVRYRAAASVFVPTGRMIVAFASDSARLGTLFAGHWATAETSQQPDATLYALTGAARDYGLDDAWDEARWWSRAAKTMIVFGCDSYRLAKICLRGICSAVAADDIMFLHGCALSFGAGCDRKGVVVTGSSGAGKTTLIAKLLERPEYPVTVINDDWGAVSLNAGYLVSTGERRLHMKSSSVLALRPGFFASALRDSYSYDLSERDCTVRLLVSPESVYGTRWDTACVAVEHVVVILREPAGWIPPRQAAAALNLLTSGSYSAYFQRREAFFNGSLILRTASEKLREQRRYQRLLKRVSLTWINNCGSPGDLADEFISAIGA